MGRKFKTETIDEPVQVKEGSLGGDCYSHPCFGMARVSHLNAKSGHSLFGSDLNHTDVFELTISGAEVTQKLGQNWYFDKDIKVRVQLTGTQFIGLMTNMNSQGVPCTINYSTDLGHIKTKMPPKLIDYTKQGLLRQPDKLVERAEDLVAFVKELTEQKKAVNKGQKETLERKAQNMLSALKGNYQFDVNNVEDAINLMIADAEVATSQTLDRIIREKGFDAVAEDIKTYLLENKSGAD
ncbi:hypothetical protein [Pseudoalteromonas phage J2-1_QLiu-2017]|nr:hypothetical protein [Pseudoalteromonas phage J2-1_QLiu-2017]